MKRLVALLLALSLPAQAAQPVARAKVSALPALVMPAVPVMGMPAPASVPTLTAKPGPILSPQVQLQSIAPQPELAASVFDGSSHKAALAPVQGSESSEPAPLGPSEPRQPKGKTAVSAYKNGFGIGAIAALAAPVLWGAEPFHVLMYTVAATMALPAVALIVQGVRRLVKGPAPAASKEKRRKVMLAGVFSGILLAMVAINSKPLVIEAGATLTKPALGVAYVKGSALSDTVRAEIQGNPEGRDVLDGLRDRAGVIHMPDFFVSDTKDAGAMYVSSIDSILVSREEIKARGWTVEQFTSDPAKQRAFVRDYLSTFVHELRHAGQFRRGLEYPGHFEPGALQNEYEAYLTEHWFAYEQAKAGKEFELGELMAPLDDVEAYLKSYDSLYPEDKLSKSPYWREQLARYTGNWKQHRVDVYEALSKHPSMTASQQKYYLSLAQKAREK